jgi:hypothetical protein
LAVVVAAIVSMVIGGLWYGPLFGKMWVELSGMTEEKVATAKAKGMWKSYLIMFIGSLINERCFGPFPCLCKRLYESHRRFSRTDGGILELARFYRSGNPRRCFVGGKILETMVPPGRSLSGLSSCDGRDFGSLDVIKRLRNEKSEYPVHEMCTGYSF